MENIYLDNNATTSLDPRVFEAMAVELAGPPANPSSLHWFGQRARGLLHATRQMTAQFFKSKPEEIIFTSGGTEGINFLLRGLSLKGHVISTNIEHSCIHKTLQILETKGLSVTYVPVDLWGAPYPAAIESAIRSDTQAIILSAANNETGVMIDLKAIGDLALKRGIPLFIDAVAFVGKEKWIHHPGISAVAISGHKFHAPKGIGALFIRSPLKIDPLLTGGNQEMMRRAGTENLSGILGLAEALQILMEKQTEITKQITSLKSEFESLLLNQLPDIQIHGEGPRISNTSNIAFKGVDGESLLMHLDMQKIAASHGSACASGAIEPSRVLTQMGVERKVARSSIRFSFSRFNTKEEIERSVEILSRLIKKLRKI